MKVDADVRGGGIETRWCDAGDRAAGRQTAELARAFVPAAGAVLGVPDTPVVGAGPDESLLDLRWCDCENHLAVELPEVVADDASRWAEVCRVPRGQIRADDRPAVAGIGRP